MLDQEHGPKYGDKRGRGLENRETEEEEREEEDLYGLLAAKERDLILAAELGKALLEKNEDLSKQNEKIAEEFSQKLECLEQEKYQLRRQLEMAEDEYTLRVAELQNDVTNLRVCLEKNAILQKQYEREKSQLVTDLTEQNQRLAVQLKEAGDNERELREELAKMRDNFKYKKSHMQEHFQHVEQLRDEILEVTQRKEDLEQRIENLLGERESLSSTLDDSADRIILMEKKHRDQESVIRNNLKENEELKTINQGLLERLESIPRSRSSSPTFRMSLLSEMEMSGSDSEKSFYYGRRPCSQIDELEEELEDAEFNSSEIPTEVGDFKEFRELSEEVLSAYQQIRNMCCLLRQREQKRRQNSGDSLETMSSGSSADITTVKIGQLNNIVLELKSLLHDLLWRDARSGSSSDLDSCRGCGRSTEARLELEAELHKTLVNHERGQISLKQAEIDAKKKEDEVQQMKSKLALLETRLAAASEEREVLKKDLEQSNLGKDEIIRRAWETRDSAVKRKNTAEVELARTRIDAMKANSQLMEAVQQKVSLAEQLEQWEVDLQLLLQGQVKEKLEEGKDDNLYTFDCMVTRVINVHDKPVTDEKMVNGKPVMDATNVDGKQVTDVTNIDGEPVRGVINVDGKPVTEVTNVDGKSATDITNVDGMNGKLVAEITNFDGKPMMDIIANGIDGKVVIEEKMVVKVRAVTGDMPAKGSSPGRTQGSWHFSNGHELDLE